MINGSPDSPKKISRYRGLIPKYPTNHFGSRIASEIHCYRAAFLIRIALLAGLALWGAGLSNTSYAVEATGQLERTLSSGRVFVVNTLSNSVSVIDDASGALIASIPVGARPIRIVASSDGQRAYVSNFGGASVSVIDTVNLVVTAKIKVPLSPQESDITIDGSRLFVVHHVIVL